MPELCKALEVKKATGNNFIALLESTHLIHRLPPFGYGKEVLCARYKVYLADAAIAPSVMPLVRAAAGARVVKIPAPLACYWLGLLEVEAADRQ